MGEERLGKYRLLRLLASGGMGEVFLARQEGPKGFSKAVVVKRILKHLSSDERFIEMFVNEARLAALLTHPNIVQIFELGQDGATWFIAMEFIHGRTLHSMSEKLKVRGQPFPPMDAARIAAAALHGLHYAHSLRSEAGQPLGIIHRDVSPDNVMIAFDGSVKVLDFGIAKAALGSKTTQAGLVKGKYAYMSPEQLDGKSLDGRSDVWAVGVMLYELLAGVRPFPAEDDGPLVKQIATTEPALLPQVAPHLPRELATLVHQALQKDPQRRWPNAEMMAVGLERIVSHAQVSLSDGRTAGFMKELFADEVADNPAASSASDASPGTSAGLYISRVNDAGHRRAEVKPARPWWRALVVGLVGASALGGIGWAMALLGAGKPVAPPVAPMPAVAAVPEAPVSDAGTEGAAPAVVEAPAPPKPAEPPPQPPAPVAARAPVAGRGRVDLRVKPWAEVFEGKRSLGVTPMPPLELAAGKHVLTLKNSDLSVAKNLSVKVPRDGVVTVRVDLRQ